jgi:hypothetical protein
VITDEAKARAQRWLPPLICVAVGKIGDKLGFSFAGTCLLIALVFLGYMAATRQPITRVVWVFTVVWVLFSVLVGRFVLHR